MKKMYLSLIIAGLSVGFTQATVAAEDSLIKDPQLTEFRSNKGKSDFWHKDADKKNGKGDVGSSKNTAFGDDGSARIRFMNADDDFSALPGLSQVVQGLQPNTDYVFSFYYSDKKGADSASTVLAGAMSMDGKMLGEKAIHVSDLKKSPKGEVSKAFRQATMEFNSGDNTTVQIYTKMRIAAAKVNMNGDIGKETEVRVDEFSLTKK